MTYFLTFDLVGDDGAGYRKVYEWALMNGGFHYFKFDHGRWGRLPSTAVLVPCATLDESVVRDEFDRELRGLGLTPNHVMVTQGKAWALQSAFLEEDSVPFYAKLLPKVVVSDAARSMGLLSFGQYMRLG